MAWKHKVECAGILSVICLIACIIASLNENPVIVRIACLLGCFYFFEKAVSYRDD